MSQFQRKLRELDLELARLMVRPEPRHHTTGDWDFDNTNWQLSSTIYVSPPSALEKYSTVSGTDQQTTLLVKTGVVPIGNVKEGRLVTQQRPGAIYNLINILFRRQDASNLYVVIVRASGSTTRQIIARKIKAGVSTNLADQSYTWGYQTWGNARVTWWNDYVGLVIRFEYWNGSTWIKLFDAYDSENLWKDTGGRVGFLLQSRYLVGSVANPYVDDTDIYGVV